MYKRTRYIIIYNIYNYINVNVTVQNALALVLAPARLVRVHVHVRMRICAEVFTNVNCPGLGLEAKLDQKENFHVHQGLEHHLATPGRGGSAIRTTTPSIRVHSAQRRN